MSISILEINTSYVILRPLQEPKAGEGGSQQEARRRNFACTQHSEAAYSKLWFADHTLMDFINVYEWPKRTWKSIVI
jgi:hypothetical protein